MAGGPQEGHRQLGRRRGRGPEPLQVAAGTLDGEDRPGRRPAQARPPRRDQPAVLGHAPGADRRRALHQAHRQQGAAGQRRAAAPHRALDARQHRPRGHGRRAGPDPGVQDGRPERRAPVEGGRAGVRPAAGAAPAGRHRQARRRCGGADLRAGAAGAPDRARRADDRPADRAGAGVLGLRRVRPAAAGGRLGFGGPGAALPVPAATAARRWTSRATWRCRRRSRTWWRCARWSPST